MKHRWVATGVAVVLLAILITPVFSLKIGQSDIESLAKSGDAYDTLHLLNEGGVSNGVLTPVEVLVDVDQADAAVKAAQGVDGVDAAFNGGESETTAVIDVIPSVETVDSSTIKVVDDVRDAEVNAFLRRMNANYSNDRGPSCGREMLAEIGERLEQLERGAIPKHFN